MLKNLYCLLIVIAPQSLPTTLSCEMDFKICSNCNKELLQVLHGSKPTN